MATVYTKTDNYGLSLYGDNDPADLRDGYNGSMRTIDTTLETHLNKTGVAKRVEEHSNVTLSGIADGFLKVFVDGLNVHFYFRGNKTAWNTDVFATVNEANAFGN